MADATTLPVVNAIEALTQENKDGRIRLQQSIRTGLMHVRHSIEALHESITNSYEEQRKANMFALEQALEAKREKEVEESTVKKKEKEMPPLWDFGFIKSLGFMGAIVTTVAASLGVLAGQLTAMTASIKTVNLLFGSGEEGFVSRMFKSIQKSFRNFVFAIQINFQSFTKITLPRILKSIASMFTPLENVFLSIGKSFVYITALFKGAGEVLKPITKTVINAIKFFQKFEVVGKSFSLLGKAFGLVFKAAQKIFAPIAIIIGLFDGITDALKEGEKKGFLGYVGGFVKGLINSLIMAPLDMLKDGIAWIVDWIGLKGLASFMRAFSLEEIFTKLVDAITDTIKSVFSWDSKKAEQEGYLVYVGKKLLDIIWMPVNGIINFVRDLFGWNKENEKGVKEKFNMTEFFIGVIDDVVEQFKKLINDILDFDYKKLLPEWAKKLLGVETGTGQVNSGKENVITVEEKPKQPNNPFTETGDKFYKDFNEFKKLKDDMAPYQNDGALVNRVGSVNAPTNVNVVAPTTSTNQTNIRNDNSNKTFVPANANKSKNSPQDYAASPLY